MLTIIALIALFAATLALLALAAKWLDFGFFGTVLFFDFAGNLLSLAGTVAAAILGGVAGSND